MTFDEIVACFEDFIKIEMIEFTANSEQFKKIQNQFAVRFLAKMLADNQSNETIERIALSLKETRCNFSVRELDIFELSLITSPANPEVDALLKKVRGYRNSIL